MAKGAAFEAVRERLEEQLQHAQRSASALEERRQEYEELKGLLIDLPKKVEHPIMVPFGSMAFFPGHLVHTNEVLTQLSSEYFALRTCENAVGLVDRRLDRLLKEKEDVDRELRELGLQQRLAGGEAPKKGERQVPGVPGATVREDEDGFLDIREPMEEQRRDLRKPTEEENRSLEEALEQEALSFWQDAPALRLDRLRELEGMEDGEMQELDDILEHAQEQSQAVQAAVEASEPVARSPADLYALMGVQEHVVPAVKPAPAATGRISKFKAERQRG